MRIALVSIDNPEDVGAWSGTPHFILEQLRRKADVELIAPLKRDFKYLYAPQKLIARLQGHNIQLDRHKLALRSYASQIEKRIIGKQFDAIIALSSIPVAYLSGGTPMLFWTDAVLDGMADYYPGPFAGLTRKEISIGHDQEQAAITRASYAIYSSDWAADMVRSRYTTKPEQIQVLEFGANLSIEHDRAAISELVDQRAGGKECVLLFMGVDWERKGGAIAFEAAKTLNERGIVTRLRVVGCDAPEAPFVDRLGFISKGSAEGQGRIKELLDTSTFFIFPTRAEASAIVLSEASGYGLPILTTLTGGLSNYVKNGETGYCLPLSAGGGEYADLIQSTLQNPETYRHLSLGAFDRYQQKLNWDSAVTRLLELAKSAGEPTT